MIKAEESTSSREGDVDVIVLGVGTCGEDLSLQLLDAGLNVVGIEASLIGGECAYWACIPSKIMIRAANALSEAGQVGNLAGNAQVKPDWSPVAKRVREATGSWDDSTATERYEKRGGRLIHGHGKLSGPHTVTVGDEEITAKRGIVIATGSKPAIPPIPGLAEIDYWTTHDVIQAQNLPRSLIVLGGGPVGCELAQLLARFGVAVTIVQRNERLLPRSEPEASELLKDALISEGITVHTGSSTRQVNSLNGSIIVTLDDGTELTGERLLVATGRQVDLSGLNLEPAGLDSTAPLIRVDERMRAADGIWAMGDVTGKALFTHVALYQSAIVASDILGKVHPPAKYNAVPGVVFTNPEIGAVGLTETEARDAGLEIVVAVKQLPSTFRGFIDAEKCGIIKVVVDRKTGILVGATAAGRQAGEMLGFLSLAVHMRVTLDDLRSMIYAFPTFYGSIGEAIGGIGRGLTTVIDPGYQGLKELDQAGRDKPD